LLASYPYNYLNSLVFSFLRICVLDLTSYVVSFISTDHTF